LAKCLQVFQFWLKNETATFKGARAMLEAAHANVNQLDRESGSSFRDDYWTDGVEK